MAAWAADRWRLASSAAVIPYCYDPTLAKSPEVVTHEGPFNHLVFFGRLETRKGLHLFCRALVEDATLRQHVDRVTFLGKPSNVEGRPSEEFIASHMEQIPGLQWNIVGDLGSFEAQAWLKLQKNILVVAPSLVDNLPFAVIELHSHRIPFVSTNIGGIPEIVGDANQYLLARPTEASLAEVIGRVCRDGVAVVDYRSGFEVAAANAAHVDFVHGMLSAPAPRSMTPLPTRAPFQIVVTDERDAVALGALRERVTALDPTTASARWLTFDEWMVGHDAAPALFVDSRATLAAGCAARLLTALEQPDVDVATSYFSRQDGSAAARIVAPLGGSLESGWRMNTFGGPCLAARPTAFAAIRDAAVNGAFAVWPAYAAVVCRGMTLSIIPVPLYTVAADAVRAGGHAELEAVLRQFHTHMPADLDLGWILKSSVAIQGGPLTTGLQGAASADTIGRALYDRLISTPDDLLAAFAGLNPETETDLRARLQHRPCARGGGARAVAQHRTARVHLRCRTAHPDASGALPEARTIRGRVHRPAGRRVVPGQAVRHAGAVPERHGGRRRVLVARIRAGDVRAAQEDAGRASAAVSRVAAGARGHDNRTYSEPVRPRTGG
jgi:hypothetical protein